MNVLCIAGRDRATAVQYFTEKALRPVPPNLEDDPLDEGGSRRCSGRSGSEQLRQEQASGAVHRNAARDVESGSD